MNGRCDRCGAKAAAEWAKAGTGRLDLCGHHDHEQAPALLTAGWHRYAALDPATADKVAT